MSKTRRRHRGFADDLVLLQPLAAEPPPHAKCKDKFLVQSAFITPDEEMRTLTEMVSETAASTNGGSFNLVEPNGEDEQICYSGTKDQMRILGARRWSSS